MQASHLLMIRPVNFGFNPETAINNSFQKNTDENVQESALQEFNDFVVLLRHNNIDVTVVEDTLIPVTPDAVFPNNWISFHEDNSIFLYPMFAGNRRMERKQHVLDTLNEKFKINQVYDLSFHEKEGLFLEGTGSMVLDRKNKIAYAALSPRTDINILREFCRITNYRAISFNSTDTSGMAIYHTNVLMCIADSYVIICLDSISDKNERAEIIDSFTLTRKEIIPISFEQLNHFAGNMLQVINTDGELLMIMSTQAYHSLTAVQVALLDKHNRIIHASLDVIETCGGGSARCMMAEIFNEVK